jgi:predicted lipoprotein with Yx(FWY)xxD motif
VKAVSVVVLALVVFAGCGDGEAADVDRTLPTQSQPTTRDAGAGGTGTRIVVGRSDFGRMLFDSKRQAIYIFQRDRRKKSNCYGDCAAAWPPVYTRGKPRAGKGVHSSLLGSIRRRGGRRQVTYAGKPLYYYAHEGPGEVECHNVNLNGGFWWAVGADGERLQ